MEVEGDAILTEGDRSERRQRCLRLPSFHSMLTHGVIGTVSPYHVCSVQDYMSGVRWGAAVVDS